MIRVATALTTATTTALTLTTVPHHRLPLVAVKAAPCSRGESERRSHSAVDAGGLRWTQSTVYDSARVHAAKVWRSSSGPLSRIKIRADSASTVNDLAWHDYDRTDGRSGHYEYRGGSGRVLSVMPTPSPSSPSPSPATSPTGRRTPPPDPS